MKVTIDTKEKTICIDDKGTLDELFKIIEQLNIDPEEYTIGVKTEYVQTLVRWYPINPWFSDPLNPMKFTPHTPQYNEYTITCNTK